MGRRIVPGVIVKTNYGTGPFRVEKVLTGCTCPEYLKSLNLGRTAPPSEEHMHLVVSYQDRPERIGWPGYLNGYREEDNGRIRSVWNADELILLDESGVQGELF